MLPGILYYRLLPHEEKRRTSQRIRLRKNRRVQRHNSNCLRQIRAHAADRTNVVVYRVAIGYRLGQVKKRSNFFFLFSFDIAINTDILQSLRNGKPEKDSRAFYTVQAWYYQVPNLYPNHNYAKGPGTLYTSTRDFIHLHNNGSGYMQEILIRCKFFSSQLGSILKIFGPLIVHILAFSQ